MIHEIKDGELSTFVRLNDIVMISKLNEYQFCSCVVHLSNGSEAAIATHDKQGYVDLVEAWKAHNDPCTIDSTICQTHWIDHE